MRFSTIICKGENSEEYGNVLAITNGPRSHLGPKNLDPEKFGPHEIWAEHESHFAAFLCRDQIYWGPNFSGTKSFWDQKSHFSYDQLSYVFYMTIIL